MTKEVGISSVHPSQDEGLPKPSSALSNDVPSKALKWQCRSY